jgi:hypothetical protein
MNLQWLRLGNCTRTGIKGAGLMLAALMISTSGAAWAQVATRLQGSLVYERTGNATLTVFTAKVADVSGNPVSGGTVSFEVPQGSLGSAVVENGVATLDVNTLPPKTTSVTAVYHGASSYSSSQSSIKPYADDASTLPDFSVTATPTSLSLNPGDFGTVAITITPINGFADMVTLSCAGLPSASACVFSPVNVSPLNGAVGTSTLQIQTQGASGTNASLRHPGSFLSGGHVAYAVVLPGMLALVGLGALRRRTGLAGLRMLGLMALLAASSLGLSSCAARYNYFHKPPAANPGIVAGTYTITLAAYASTGTAVTSHTLNLTLTVK